MATRRVKPPPPPAWTNPNQRVRDVDVWFAFGVGLIVVSLGFVLYVLLMLVSK